MALHDYVCPVCGTVLRDQYRPIAVGANADPPTCPTCGATTRWIPAVGRMDAGSGSAFVAFDQQVLQPDGSHKTVRIDSLRKLRQVEKDTETAARNGEGQRLLWRDYSQDKSNADVHTMGPDPATAAREALAKMEAELPEVIRDRRKARGGPLVTPVNLDPSSVSLGPGVTPETSGGIA